MACNMLPDSEYEKLNELCLLHDKGLEISLRLKNALGLVRFECQYGSRYFKQDLAKIGKNYRMAKKHWYQLTDSDLHIMFDKFFNSRVGKGLETMNTKEIKSRFEDSAVELGYKSGLGLKAFATWNLIKTIGHLNVYSLKNPDSMMSRATFARHKQIAIKAGLTQADFQSGEVLVFSREVINFIAVDSWEQLKDLAA